MGKLVSFFFFSLFESFVVGFKFNRNIAFCCCDPSHILKKINNRVSVSAFVVRLFPAIRLCARTQEGDGIEPAY